MTIAKERLGEKTKLFMICYFLCGWTEGSDWCIQRIPFLFCISCGKVYNYIRHVEILLFDSHIVDPLAQVVWPSREERAVMYSLFHGVPSPLALRIHLRSVRTLPSRENLLCWCIITIIIAIVDSFIVRVPFSFFVTVLMCILLWCGGLWHARCLRCQNRERRRQEIFKNVWDGWEVERFGWRLTYHCAKRGCKGLECRRVFVRCYQWCTNGLQFEQVTGICMLLQRSATFLHILFFWVAYASLRRFGICFCFCPFLQLASPNRPLMLMSHLHITI